MENHTKGGQIVFYKEGQAPIRTLPERVRQKATPESPADGSLQGEIQLNEQEKQSLLYQGLSKLWEEVLSKGNYTIFMTVSFAHRYADSTSLDGLNFLLKVLNSAIWGRRYGKDPTVGLKGIIVAEPHERSRRRIRRYFADRLHFHIMLEGQPEIADVDAFRDLVIRQMHHVKCNGRCMLAEDCIDVQAAGNVEGLANYLTKCMRRREWKHAENICFLRPGGIDGVCIPKNRPILDSWTHKVENNEGENNG